MTVVELMDKLHLVDPDTEVRVEVGGDGAIHMGPVAAIVVEEVVPGRRYVVISAERTATLIDDPL